MQILQTQSPKMSNGTHDQLDININDDKEDGMQQGGVLWLCIS